MTKIIVKSSLSNSVEPANIYKSPMEFTILPNEECQCLEEPISDNEPFNITIDKFSEYRRCQKLGKFNMLEYSKWEPYTSLTEGELHLIISNYGNYKKNFEVMIACKSSRV